MQNIGVWLLSVVAMVFLPCLPVIIEWLRTGDVKEDTLTITVAVMAAGFIFTASHVLLLSSYIILFIGSLLLNTAVSPATPINVHRWDVIVLAVVATLHAVERLGWHVVLSQPFPEKFALRRETASEGSEK